MEQTQVKLETTSEAQDLLPIEMLKEIIPVPHIISAAALRKSLKTDDGKFLKSFNPLTGITTLVPIEEALAKFDELQGFFAKGGKQ